MEDYSKFFESYITELRQIKKATETCWEALVAAEMKLTQDRSAAEAALRERWPFGPTSHPWVIATFRKYYLLCEQLNKKREESELEKPPVTPSDEDWGIEDEEKEGGGSVNPRVLMWDWLSGGETEDLYQFMLFLVFVPIGLKDGELL